MDGTKAWATNQLRMECLQTIQRIVDASNGRVKLPPVLVEKKILSVANRREDYLGIIQCMEKKISEKLKTTNSIDENQLFMYLPEITQARVISTPIVPAAQSQLSPQNSLDAKRAFLISNLQQIIQDHQSFGLRAKSVDILKNSISLVSTEPVECVNLVESYVIMLMKKPGTFDEIEFKILELQCEKMLSSHKQSQNQQPVAPTVLQQALMTTPSQTHISPSRQPDISNIEPNIAAFQTLSIRPQAQMMSHQTTPTGSSILITSQNDRNSILITSQNEALSQQMNKGYVRSQSLGNLISEQAIQNNPISVTTQPSTNSQSQILMSSLSDNSQVARLQNNSNEQRRISLAPNDCSVITAQPPPPPPYNQTPNQPKQLVFVDLTSSYEPQLTKSSQSRPIEGNYRRDDREALFKAIVEIEGKVASQSKSVDEYRKFFKGLFLYAAYSLEKMNNPNASTEDMPATITNFEQLRELLANEPANVAESVMKSWKDIDNETKKILESTIAPGVDIPYNNIELPPDEFQNKLSDFVESVRLRDPDKQ